MKTPTNSSFDLQPTLRGERVLIRPLEASDFAALFAAASDPKIWEQHPESDRYTERVFKEFFDGAMASGGAFAFVDRQSGRIIGSSRYHGYNPEKSEIEIGWTFLERTHWGGEYNREIKRLMVEHAFRFVETVVFFVGEGNRRSQRALEKIGAVRRPGIELTSAGRKTSRHVVYEIRKAEPRV